MTTRFLSVLRATSSVNRISARFGCGCPKLYSTSGDQPTSVADKTTKDAHVGGFAQAFEKHSKLDSPAASGEQTPFATLLRNSKFIDLGDPEQKVVTGSIFHVVGDDLYIDIGMKFHCVCPRPTKNASEYVRGAKVRVRVKELELSTKFLGSERDLTLLEADASLIGIIYSPARTSSEPTR